MPLSKELERRLTKLEGYGLYRLDEVVNTLGEVLGRLGSLEGRLQNLEHVITVVGEIADRVEALETATCEECGANVPHGQGLGFSEPEENWIDRSKPRGIRITPLCNKCIGKRMSI